MILGFGTILFLALISLAIVSTILFLINSIKLIGPTEVGLVVKRLGAKLPDDNPIALNGEAGYQADLLMPGLRFVVWPIYAVTKYPWVQSSSAKGRSSRVRTTTLNDLTTSQRMPRCKPSPLRPPIWGVNTSTSARST